MMKKIKITLVKSPIDRPERQKLTVRALGLNKTNSTKEVEATPQILGMIRKVTHLLKSGRSIITFELGKRGVIPR
ncbi:MAG: 50S ribosomal protein L30 [Chitinophagaceae bacterium]|nr:50S ribosomal protein L30 [Chitinophagaceae bacterium]